MIQHRSGLSLAGAAMVLALGLGLAGPAQAEKALEKVTLRLDWLPTGTQAPFYLAAERGYFRDEGIEVEIFDGKGSTSTVQAIAGGADTFGFASLDVAALAVAKGAPVLGVMGITQKNPGAILSLQGSGIEKPKDLEGKSIGLVPTDAAARLFPAFIKANGLDAGKIKQVQITYSTLYTSLLQGNVDGVIAFDIDALKIAKFKPAAKPVLFADYGVNSMAAGVIVHKDTIAKNEALVRGFLKATAKGVEDTLKDPAAGAAAVKRARPDADQDMLEGQARMMEAHLHTEKSRGHPVGWMAKEDWEGTRKLLATYFDMTADIKDSDIYTNAYLPSK